MIGKRMGETPVGSGVIVGRHCHDSISQWQNRHDSEMYDDGDRTMREAGDGDSFQHAEIAWLVKIPLDLKPI
jgi:hypothetical protein